MTYSDGSITGYELSTANVQAAINNGAILVDTTGNWTGTSSSTLTPPVTQITVYSETTPTSGVWYIQLLYSDGVTVSKTLSTQNVQAYRNNGATLIDLTGDWS